MPTIEEYRRGKLDQLKRSDGTIPKAGELLKEFRTRLGLSQRKLAGKSGVDESTIARIEIGASKLLNKISFFEGLRSIDGLNESEISNLLFTPGAPRWLEPTDKKEAQNAGVIFGRKLHYFRERVNLSQRNLASQSGIDESTISRMELGTRRPPAQIELFYASLPTALKLSDTEYADLLLTSKPPRWLVPELYNALINNDVQVENQTYKISRRVVTSVRNNILETTFYTKPGQFTNSELMAFEKIVEGLSLLYLYGKLQNAKEILDLLGLGKVRIRPSQR